MGTSILVVSPTGEGTTAQKAALPASSWALSPAPTSSFLRQIAAKSGPRSRESGSCHNAAPGGGVGKHHGLSVPWSGCQAQTTQP